MESLNTEHLSVGNAPSATDSWLDYQPQVIAALAKEQYDGIITHCEQCLSVDPTVLSAYWYLGLAWLLQGDDVEAQSAWLAAATAVPTALDDGLVELQQLLTSVANDQLHTGKPHVAERLCWQLLDLDESQTAVYLTLGTAIARQGRYDEAIAHWQTALEQQPDLAEAYRYQGEVWQRLGQIPEAIAAYTQALTCQPEWHTHYNLGLCFGQQRQWQAAIEQFNQAIQLNAEWTAAYGDRAWAWLQQGNWKAAQVDFYQATQHKSGFVNRYCEWVETLKQGDSSTPHLDGNAQVLQILSSAAVWDDPDRLRTVFSSKLRPLEVNPVPGDTSSPVDQVCHENSVASPSNISPRPDGFYLTAQDWITRVGGDNTYTALDPASLVPLTAPKTLTSDLHFSFRFGQQVMIPGSFVVTLNNGRCWSDRDQSSQAILTAENQLLGDLSADFPLLSPGHSDKHPSRHRIFAMQSLPAIEPVEGTVAVLAGLTNDMYFHWMFDVLPRFHLLQRSGIDLDRIDYFLVNHRLPFQQETLKVLGIPEVKLLDPEEHLHVQATRLIVPSYPGSPAWMPKWACEWLRDRFLPEAMMDHPPRNRLYITRQSTRARRVINEADVLEVLEPLGFQWVALESLSVIEQAAWLASAEVVIAPHGGGLTNLVFCQPGTTVIELFSPHYLYPCYWLVSNQVGLKYYYLPGITPEGYFWHRFLYPNARIEDILVDLNELRAILQAANVAPKEV